MAQNSIAYGESLLADVRKRNSEEYERRKKEAKKDTWKALGAKLAIGLADTLYEAKTNQLLNNEDRLREKLQTTNALDLSEQYVKTEADANAFEGGRSAYFTSKAMPEVENYLQTKYAQGTYNPSSYNLFKKQLASQWGAELEKMHTEGYDHTQNFLAVGGGDKDAYVKAVTAGRGKNAMTGLFKMIGRSTGILEDDVNSNTESLLEKSKDLIKYKTTYNATRSSALAAFVTEQGLLDNVDLGTAPPKYEFIKRKTELGGETMEVAMTTTDKNGVQKISFISPNANGEIILDTPESKTARQSFDLTASKVLSSTNKTYLNAGKSALVDIGGEKSEELTKVFQDIVDKAGHKSTSKSGQDMMESLNDKASSEAGAIVYHAKKEGWATHAEAKIIAGEMIVEAYTTGNQQRVLSGAGLINPYHTMFAVNRALDSQKIASSDGLAVLGGMDNIVNMYNAYRTETKDGRDRIDALLESSNYFEGKVGPLFKDIHKTIQATMAKGLEGTEDNLGLVYQELFSPKESLDKDSAKVKETLTPPISMKMSEFAVPPTAPKDRKERKEEKAESRKQRVAYMSLLKANKELQRILNLDKSLIGIKAYDTLLKKAQKDFESQALAYKNIYG